MESTGFLPNPQRAAFTFKELLAQFRAEVALQSLANFRVHRTHFLTCQCATPISICQSICKRLSFRSETGRTFAGEQIEQFHAFEQRLLRFLNRPLNFRVRNFFRHNHRNVARD